MVEAAIWRRLTAFLPDGYLDAGGQLILRRVCAQAMFAERHEERLRQLAEADGDHLEVEAQIERQLHATTKMLIYSMNALRAVAGDIESGDDAVRQRAEGSTLGDARQDERADRAGRRGRRR